MGTLKQKKLARAIVENIDAVKPLNKGELVESVGYAEVTSKAKPGLIINQKGVQEELISLGFNEDTAKQVVSEILIGGENDTVKLKAAEMIFKVHGTYAPEKSLNINVEATQPSQRIRELAEKLKEIDD